jgi:septum site-determining protein MinD
MTSNNKSSESQEGKILAIASGKGGTGKTVSTLNLGMALHEMGKDVLIIDADIEDPNIGINLGIYSPDVTINEALQKEQSLLESLYVHDSGLRVIPASLSINYINSSLRPIENLIKKIGGYVLIDCGPGLGENVIPSLRASDGVVGVTNPMRSSLSGAMRLAEVTRDLGVPMEGIIVNNITAKEVSPEEVEHITGCKILGEIPYDPKIDESIAKRKPLIRHRPHSPASVSFKKIAHRMVGSEYNPPFTHHFKRVFGSIKSFFS